jgi:O-antigen/teichoic acid export membrane protein
MSRAGLLKESSSAAQVAGSQLALAGSNYLVLALAARNLDAAGFAALSSYYLLINTVGRGLFAAVELETTRAVAHARAAGLDDGPAKRAALRHTGVLLAGAFVLLGASSPLLAGVVGSGVSAIGMLAIGAVAMAASYLLRGPLAGQRRYGRYAATFGIEALAGLGAAVGLVLAGVGDTTAWIAVLALSPLVAAVVLGRGAWRSPATEAGADVEAGADAPTGGESSRRAVLWSAALLLAGQGVWNIAPVLVTGRLAAEPAVAAGFVTVAVILRAPVLFFPSVQALLLPKFAAMAGTGDDEGVRRTTRKLAGLIAGAGVLWVAIAIFVVPTVSHIVFGTTTTPPAWVLAVLAVSTVVGATAQIGQTHLVAVRRPAAAAVAWIAGLAVLVVVGLLAAQPLTAATLGQLAGAIAVLVVLSLVRRRRIAS